MGLIYLDSCLVIYLAERRPIWYDVTVAAMIDAAAARYCISPLVKAECLVGPLRNGDAVMVQEFQQRFDEVTTLDLPEIVYLKAAGLRASTSLKLPDALHVACAQHHGCVALWTNDNRLSPMGNWVRVLTPA